MHTVLLWLIVLGTWTCACVQAGQPVIEVVPDPPVRFNDEAKASKFIVGVDRDGDAARLLPDDSGQLITMRDAAGRSFNCKLPAAPPNVTRSSDEQSNEGEESAQSPTELLDRMAGLCFYRAEDWWTYELCFQKGVRQFHKDAPQQGVDIGTGLMQISLGQYNRELSDTEKIQVLDIWGTPGAAQVDSGSTRRDVSYVSQMYTGGEPCDITGATRETEVRFVCGESRSDVIASIKEPSTCHYLMIVQTPRLCNHPGFNVLKPPVAHILCRIAGDDSKEAALAETPGSLSDRENEEQGGERPIGAAVEEQGDAVAPDQEQDQSSQSVASERNEL